MSSQALKRKISSSVNGEGVSITATSDPGTTIHTAVAGTTDGTYDEIWLWAYNSYINDLVLTISYGGSEIIVTVPYKCGLVPILPGLILYNSGVVSAYSTESGAITIFGFTHRLSDIAVV